MSQVTAPARAKRSLKLLYSRLLGNQPCPACGFCGRFITRDVLWPELIAEWELSPQWARWFNLREGQSCPRCGSNLRSGQLAQAILAALKSMLEVTATSLNKVFEDPKVRALRIAEINSAGALHQFLAKCSNLHYSEFGSKTAGVPSEDLMNLSYTNSTFDLVITSETLEHVPDIDVALREIHRILKPGGIHLFTVPIVLDRPATRQRARIENGKLVYASAPSYHGGAQVEKSDHLVFYEFGADFIERCKQSGFELGILRDEKNLALATFTARKIV